MIDLALTVYHKNRSIARAFHNIGKNKKESPLQKVAIQIILLFFNHGNTLFSIKLIQYIELVDLFSYIADEKVDIVLSDLKATMPKEFRKGDDVAAVEDPLLCEGMAVAVNACGLHTSAFVIFIEHMIARAFRELLTENVAEKEIVI